MLGMIASEVVGRGFVAHHDIDGYLGGVTQQGDVEFATALDVKFANVGTGNDEIGREVVVEQMALRTDELTADHDVALGRKGAQLVGRRA